MPSTRKQKAHKKQSRLFDVMSDIENIDIMLGGYPRSDNVDGQNGTDTNLDLESNRLQ